MDAWSETTLRSLAFHLWRFRQRGRTCGYVREPMATFKRQAGTLAAESNTATMPIGTEFEMKRSSID